LLEAMAAGLPVVASDWDGYPEVLPEHYRSLLVPTLASHAVANAVPSEDLIGLTDAAAAGFWPLVGTLQRVLNDAALREALIAHGRHQVSQFGWNHIARRYITLWRSLMQQRRSGRTTSQHGQREVWHPASSVDGLATLYLDPGTRLHLESLDADGVIGTAARQLLQAARRVPSPDVTVAELLAATPELTPAECERAVLQLVRVGAFGVPDLTPQRLRAVANSGR